MKEITLKEWSAYLPYGLKLWYEDNKDIYPLLVSNNTVSIRGGFNINDVKSYNLKPILYDLSWLKRNEFREEILIYFKSLGIDAEIVIYDSGNDIENDFTLLVNYRLMGETFTDALINRGSTEETPRRFFEWLCKNHFNVFNLPDELIVRVTEDFNPYK